MTARKKDPLRDSIARAQLALDTRPAPEQPPVDLDAALHHLAAELAGTLAATVPRPLDPARVAAAADLEPRCAVEWRLALAVAGCECASGFDLQAHVRLVAATVKRIRRVRVA